MRRDEIWVGMGWDMCSALDKRRGKLPSAALMVDTGTQGECQDGNSLDTEANSILRARWRLYRARATAALLEYCAWAHVRCRRARTRPVSLSLPSFRVWPQGLTASRVYCGQVRARRVGAQGGYGTRAAGLCRLPTILLVYR